MKLLLYGFYNEIIKNHREIILMILELSLYFSLTVFVTVTLNQRFE